MTLPIIEALLPPASLAVLALVLLLLPGRPAILAVGALVLLSVEGVSRLLILPLLLAPAAASAKPPAAIVVLAGDMPDLLASSSEIPGLDTLERLRAAAVLARRTGAPILVSGGRAADGPVPVASRMALSLQTDFSRQASWAETTSTNLWQSAAASAAILRGAGIADIYLVAQPWELRLSVAVFRAAGLAVTPVPLPSGDPSALDASVVVAFTPAWLDSALAMRQWAGLACQALSACASWMAEPTPGPS